MTGAFLAPVPALTVGVLVMRGGEVQAAAWILNLAAAVVGISMTALALAWRRTDAPPRVSLRWPLIVGFGLLGTTLLPPGTEGVHRWLPLLPVGIHAGALLLPLLLVALWKAPWGTAATVATAILTVLAFQPDAAQAASFCAAWIGICIARRERSAGAVMGLSLLLAAACLLRADPLEPVSYVEGIVGMAAVQSPLLAGAGLLSIIVLPLAFAFFLDLPIGIVLAAYMAGTLVSAWLGSYPVPILGYGVSPILGYYGAITLYVLYRRWPGRSRRGTPAAV